MTTHRQDLARIASNIDRHGIRANEAAISMVIDRAWLAGVDPVLQSVLSDVTQPEIARARAFGEIATALATAAPAMWNSQATERGQHLVMAAA
jgi:hypothetical protein